MNRCIGVIKEKNINKSELIFTCKICYKDKSITYEKECNSKNELNKIDIEKKDIVSFKIEDEKVKEMEKLKYYLPNDTQQLILKNSNIENLNLKINKYIDHSKKKGEEDFSNINLNKDIIKSTIKPFIKSYEETITKLDLDFLGNNGVELKTDSRLIVGLGEESTNETSIRVHHIYGVPYIPGSSLKGVCRSAFLNLLIEKEFVDENILCLEKLFEEISFDNNSPNHINKLKSLDDDKFKNRFSIKVKNDKPKQFSKNILEETSIESFIKAFQIIFGTQEQKGKVTFFDSFSELNLEKDNSFNLEYDIMTPHYSKYYGESKPPADYYPPNPIKFLTIKKDTSFKFFIGYQKDISDWPEKNSFVNLFSEEKDCKEKSSPLDIKCFLTCLLKYTLKNLGVGAKTSVGYGYFEEDEEYKKELQQMKIKEQNRLEEEKKQKIKAEEQKKIDSMSEFDKFLYTINEENIDNNFKELDNFKDNELLEVAKKFKETYQKMDKWEGKQSKKQKIKIDKINEIISSKS